MQSNPHDATSGSNSNLNNSTASAHLNVYKPTFIINNSYQPNEGENGKINDPHNMQVSAGPSREKKEGDSAKAAKAKVRGPGSSGNAPAASKSKTTQSGHQQMLLMNVLMSQGMDRASAHAQVQAQMNAHNKDKAVAGVRPSSHKNAARYRPIGSATNFYDKDGHQMRTPHHPAGYAREVHKSSTDIRYKTDIANQRQTALAGSFSMANLPQASNIVTGGKMVQADAKRQQQQSHGMLRKK